MPQCHCDGYRVYTYWLPTGGGLGPFELAEVTKVVALQSPWLPGLPFLCSDELCPAVSKTSPQGTSLVVQWLRLHASTAGGASSIPGPGTKIPHAAWCGPQNE